MAQVAKKGFNLLRPQVEPETKWDRMYAWINGTARLIVIIVEMVVIGCFVVRIIIDRQAQDYEKILQSNKAQLDSLKVQEQSIIDLQGKLDKYAEIWKISSSIGKYVDEIYDYKPTLIPKLSVNLTQEEFSLSGEAMVKDVGELENIFKKSQTLQNVQLSSYRPEGPNPTDSATFQIVADLLTPLRDPLVDTPKGDDSTKSEAQSSINGTDTLAQN